MELDPEILPYMYNIPMFNPLNLCSAEDCKFDRKKQAYVASKFRENVFKALSGDLDAITQVILAKDDKGNARLSNSTLQKFLDALPPSADLSAILENLSQQYLNEKTPENKKIEAITAIFRLINYYQALKDKKAPIAPSLNEAIVKYYKKEIYPHLDNVCKYVTGNNPLFLPLLLGKTEDPKGEVQKYLGERDIPYYDSSIPSLTVYKPATASVSDQRLIGSALTLPEYFKTPEAARYFKRTYNHLKAHKTALRQPVTDTNDVKKSFYAMAELYQNFAALEKTPMPKKFKNPLKDIITNRTDAGCFILALTGDKQSAQKYLKSKSYTNSSPKAKIEFLVEMKKRDVLSSDLLTTQTQNLTQRHFFGGDSRQLTTQDIITLATNGLIDEKTAKNLFAKTSWRNNPWENIGTVNDWKTVIAALESLPSSTKMSAIAMIKTLFDEVKNLSQIKSEVFPHSAAVPILPLSSYAETLRRTSAESDEPPQTSPRTLDGEALQDKSTSIQGNAPIAPVPRRMATGLTAEEVKSISDPTTTPQEKHKVTAEDRSWPLAFR